VALGRHSGVVTVGLGASGAGAPLHRVYLAHGADAAAIPARFGGFATEIARAAPTIPCSSTPTFYPGDPISRDIPDRAPQIGTLGAIVLRTDKEQGNKQERYLLTNKHVLVADLLKNDAVSIYKGTRGSCNNPGAKVRVDPTEKFMFKGNRLLKDSTFFALDIAIAPLLAGVKSSNRNSDISNFNAQIRDLWQEYMNLQALQSMPAFQKDQQGQIDAADQAQAAINAAVLALPANQRNVKKIGGRTDYTEGQIVGICGREIDANTGEGRYLLQLLIKPTTKAYKYDETYTFIPATAQKVLDHTDPAQIGLPLTVTATVLSTDASGNKKIRIKGDVFSLKGDSGSLVLDDQGKAVGLLNAGALLDARPVGADKDVDIPNGLTIAQFIVPAFAQMENFKGENDLAEKPIATLALIPPGDPASAQPLAIEGFGRTRDENQELADRLEDLVGRGPDAQRLVRIARAHLAELRNLIHHCRRVTVSWHRNKGPGYIAAIERSLRARTPVPREIDGLSLASGMRAMRFVLMQEGSEGLKAALAAHADWFITLLEQSDGVEDALGRLTAGAAGAVAAPPCGVRVINAKGVPGTIGAALRRHDGRLVLLASHHVIHGRGAVTGDPVFALDSREGALVEIGCSIGGWIGRLTVAGEPVFADCAAVLCHDLSTLPIAWRERLAALARFDGLAEPIAGAAAFKDGAATGRTAGRIADVDFSDVTVIEGDSFETSGQILVTPVAAEGQRDGTEVNFCAPGDSGTALFDAQGRLVGLIWGTNSLGEGIASPIGAVLEALGLGDTVQLPALEMV
jgi:hypothetical protein